MLVDDERELVDAVAALSRPGSPPSAKPGVGIVSGQAGPMVLLTDRLRSTGLACLRWRGDGVPLGDLLPPLTYQRNPVDTGRPGETFPAVLTAVGADPAVDVLAVMGLLEPDAFDLAAAIRSAASAEDVPVVAVIGGPPAAVAAARAGLAAENVAAYDGVAGAVAGLRALVDDARHRAGRGERGEPVRLVVPHSFRMPSGKTRARACSTGSAFDPRPPRLRRPGPGPPGPAPAAAARGRQDARAGGRPQAPGRRRPSRGGDAAATWRTPSTPSTPPAPAAIWWRRWPEPAWI